MFIKNIVAGLGIGCLVLPQTAANNATASPNAPGLSPAAVNLRTAGNFAVLAQSGISTVPKSSITGDIGVSSAATTLTGFGLTLDISGTFSTSTQVIGKCYAGSYLPPTPAKMTTAVADMQAAYNDASGRTLPNFTNLGAGGIGGLTLTPGLYKWTTSVSASSGFTISGLPTDVWIFQVAGNLKLASAARATLVGALPSNVIWVVAGTVTLGSTSHLEGVILGKTSVTLQTSSSLNGRILAQSAVALQSATVVG